MTSFSNMLCTKYFTRNTKKDYYRLGQAITNQRHVSYKKSGMQSILCIIYNILDVSSIVLGCVVLAMPYVLFCSKSGAFCILALALGGARAPLPFLGLACNQCASTTFGKPS